MDGNDDITSEDVGTHSNKSSYIDIGLRLSTIIIILIVIIAIGIISGISAFFVLQKREIENARHNLEINASIRTDALNRIFDDTLKALSSANTLLSIGSDDYYRHWKPFTNKQFPSIIGLRSLQFARYVSGPHRENYEKSMRAYGSEFTNFTILAPNPNGEAYIAPISNEYYVVTYVYPYSRSALGLDMQSSVERNATIQKAKSSKSSVATQKILLVDGQTAGSIIFSPVYNNSDTNSILGFVLGVFRMDLLIEASHSDKDTLSRRIIVTVYDHSTIEGNKTFSDTQLSEYNNSGMIYSSVTPDQSQSMIGKSGSLTTDDQRRIIQSAPFIAERSVMLADRTWRIIFTPMPQFISVYRLGDKWVALFLCIGGCIILDIIIIFIAAIIFIRVESNKKVAHLDRVRLITEEKNKKELTDLLNRISNEEIVMRLTMNAIAVSIISVDLQGNIIRSNDSFYKLLGCTEKDIENGINVATFFHELDPTFFIQSKFIDLVDTKIKTRIGRILDVKVSSNPLIPSRNSNIRDQLLNTEISSNAEYVIVIHDVSQRVELVQEVKCDEEQVDRFRLEEFEHQFENDVFKRDLLEFCKHEKNDEMVTFLILVQKYRQQKVEKRMELQREIFDKYIRVGAKYQLNISADLSQDIESKINKGLVHIDTYKKIEEFVKIMIITDVLPRFHKHYNSSS